MQQTRQTAVGTFPGLRCAHPTSGSCSAGQGDTLHPTERVRTLYPYAPVLIHYVSFGSGAASTHNTHYAMSANENQSRTLHLPTLHNFCSLCDIINKPEKPLWRELRLLLVIYRRVIWSRSETISALPVICCCQLFRRIMISEEYLAGLMRLPANIM